MTPFTRHTGRVAALPRINVDTDQIVPKQFLQRVERTGFGQHLFHDWRYLPDGLSDPAFELNQRCNQGASILLTGANFGSGSSREHAVWALGEYGFRAILAPSFADIFFSNCCRNGIVPARLPPDAIAELFRRHAASRAGYELTVDLLSECVTGPDSFQARFSLDVYRRDLLLRGLDEIGSTLLEEPRIAAFERRRTWLTARMNG